MKGNRVSNWRDLIDPVQDKLSIVLELWDTGGGCTALQAFLEGDVTVVVTDSPSSKRGQEAHITSATRRRQLGEENVGFYVGVYREEGTVMHVGMDAPSASIKALPGIIANALDLARNTNASFTATTKVTIPAPGKDA